MDLNLVWETKDLIMAGLAYTVMGILIVFAILVIIMLVIKAMALFSGEEKPKAVQVPVQTPSQPVPAVVEEKADDSELIAAITAAIAVFTEQSTSDFVVRSYKKVSGGAWNKAGRREMLENRF